MRRRAAVLLALLAIGCCACRCVGQPSLDDGAGIAADVPKQELVHSADAIAKAGYKPIQITVVDATAYNHTTYAWALTNAATSASMFSVSPVETAPRYVNMTAKATRKKVGTIYRISGTILIQNTNPFEVPYRSVAVTATPKPLLNLQSLLNPPNITGLGGPGGLIADLLNRVDNSLDNVLNGEAKSILDPSNGLLSSLGLEVRGSDKDAVSPLPQCDGDVIPALDGVSDGLLQCNYTVYVKSGVRTLVTAAALVEVREAGTVKIVSTSSFVNFTNAVTENVDANAALELSLTGRRIAPKASVATAGISENGGTLVDANTRRPLTSNPITVSGTYVWNYAVALGPYCSTEQCTSGACAQYVNSIYQYNVTATLTPETTQTRRSVSSYITVKIGACPSQNVSPSPAPAPSPSPAPPSTTPVLDILNKVARISQQKRAQAKAEIQVVKQFKAEQAAVVADEELMAAVAAAPRMRLDGSRAAGAATVAVPRG